MKRPPPISTRTHPLFPYSTLFRSPVLRNLEARSERQIPFSTQEAGDHTFQLDVGVKGKNFWVTRNDLLRARTWFGEGFTEALKTPDNTLRSEEHTSELQSPMRISSAVFCLKQHTQQMKS